MLLKLRHLKSWRLKSRPDKSWLFACLCFGLFLSFKVFGAPTPAHAEVCSSDRVPAATVLFPFFEVDLRSCNKRSGDTTTLRLTNVSASSQIAHVVLWSDWGVPVFAFDLYLIGYASSTLELKELLCQGNYPGVETGGIQSSVLSEEDRAHLQAWLTGEESPLTGSCAGSDRKNRIAVGYVTVDVRNELSGTSLGTEVFSPASGESYFEETSSNNVLLGDFYLEPKLRVPGKRACGRNKRCKRLFKRSVGDAGGVRGAPAIQIEADNSTPVFFDTGDRTFYGRYLSGNGTDRREPLPSIFSSRFSQAKNSQNYDLLIWRENRGDESPRPCGFPPSSFPLEVERIVAFDESANAKEISLEIPLATQRVKGIVERTGYQNGWIYFNLDSGHLNPIFGTVRTGAAIVQLRNNFIDGSGVAPLIPSTCE